MKSLHKDTLLQITHTFKRFVSILLMALLGVGFFAGIKATGPDMEKTVDKYLDEQNIYDIEIVSTLGLSDKDISAIKEVEGINTILPTYSTDLEFNINEKSVIAKAYAWNETKVNNIKLIEGKFPTEEAECVVEKNFLTTTKLKIGDEIMALNLDEDSILKDATLKIVGIVESGLYISRERGSSKLGSGLIDRYMYINEKSFSSSIYTESYITVSGAKELNTFGKKYEELIQNIKEKLEKIADVREEERYNEILEEANKTINENQQKLDDAKKEADEEISEAERKIANGEKQISNIEFQIKQNTNTADAKFAEAEEQINTAEKTILSKEEEFNKRKPEILAQITQGEKAKVEIEKNIETINASILAINKQYEGITDPIKLQEKEAKLLVLTENKKVLNTKLEEVEKALKTADATITQTESQILGVKTEIAKNRANLETQKNDTYSQINSAKVQIRSKKTELANAKITLEEEKEKANKEISDAEQKLADARDELSKLEKPTWYILDRGANTGCNGYKQDTQRIANIGKVFPIVFFIVATLISLTSMTRMVEEQRVQIGTLKALGYNKIQIASKYLIYAFLATVIGGIIGMLIGFNLLPKIIFSMYKMMYTLPDIIQEFNWYYASLGLTIAIVCIVGATAYSCIQELKCTPAELMRPKAPRPGKRVLLEKIPLIWNRFNFTWKVTARNIFRYKKRFLMTIIGICGCTALIVAGFGLKNSISSMIPLQYGEIYNYDILVSFKPDLTENEKDNKAKELNNKEEVIDTLQVNMQAGKISVNEEEKDIQIVVPQDSKKLTEFILLRENSMKKQEYTLNDDTVIVSQKVCKLLNIKPGDEIKLKNNDGKETKVKVQAITENYIYHYLYISPNLYKKCFDEVAENNAVLLKNIDLTAEQEEALAKNILEDKEKIAGVNKNSTAVSMMDDTMKSLDSVVWVLIVSAGLLAFVVLYNLSNVNISERIRELATIKVLGFYDNEVYNYISKETVVLTIIGIIIGLVGGYFLNLFIIQTCELDIIMFNKVINPISYVYAATITAIFTLIVNIATYFRLKKIDMIESLKSIE